MPPPAPPPAALAGIDRVALSRFLEKPARAAMQARHYPRAIALYRGLAAARGPGNPIALDLARAWTLAGRYEDAADVLDDFIATATELALVEQARAERDRVRKQRFFFDKGFAVPPATGEARRAFDLGRRAFKKKRFAEALIYYETGHALDPDMPGFLRELGATYDKLGAPAERLAFYQRYLHLRPLGQNADFVRRQLIAARAPLGQLNVSSALQCDEFWMGGTRGSKLPMRAIKLPPGTFKLLCVNFGHELAYFEYATVEAGKTTDVRFRWAIVENRLTDPLGRIRIEDPRSGDMIDVGVSSPSVGVIVPPDGRALRIDVVSEEGSRREERYLTLKDGGHYPVAW